MPLGKPRGGRSIEKLALGAGVGPGRLMGAGPVPGQRCGALWGAVRAL